MIVRIALEQDFDRILGLAGEVEHWFGAMVGEPGFHRAVRSHIGRGTALVAEGDGKDLFGGLLFGVAPPAYHVDWLVVSAGSRGQGVGRALLDAALGRFVAGPGTLDVVTFGDDHPGAVASGARVFYERLGFTAGEVTEPGPEGGSRQIYRRSVGGARPAG
ncbi:GNAT family N-acetyltransferase [Streptomyces sp. CAU 1734]|uniref:GNAT family N-acetyltransferase n=1 Tax=Streptomyces sp. CAU 1734 TaxID=3140360 RepID=UPI00326157A3